MKKVYLWVIKYANNCIICNGGCDIFTMKEYFVLLLAGDYHVQYVYKFIGL